MNWLKERFGAAINALVEDYFKFALGSALILLLVALASALGIQTELLQRPSWWPFGPPPKTAEFKLARNMIEGSEGYGFVTAVFDSVESHLDGQGSLFFEDEQIRRIRVCRNITIPPQEDASELLESLVSKLSPCLTKQINMDIEKPAYRIDVSENESVRIIQRHNKGEQEDRNQYFCDCGQMVIDAFQKRDLP